MTGNTCYPNNLLVFPGQTAFFTIQRGDGSFDYNCDGVEEKQYTQLVTLTPVSDTQCVVTGSGWYSQIPNCGTAGCFAVAGQSMPRDTSGECNLSGCTQNQQGCR